MELSHLSHEYAFKANHMNISEKFDLIIVNIEKITVNAW